MRTNRRLAAFGGFLTVALAFTAALAAPSVNSVSGNMAAGSTVTISGSSFGAGDTSPLLWENFEAGTASTNLHSSPQIGTWQLNTSPVSQYSAAAAHSGSQSAYAWHDNSHQWSNFNVLMSPADKLYQTFWFRYNVPTGGTGQAKLSQIHGNYWDQTGTSDYAPGVMTGGFAGTWWASYISTETGARDLSTRGNYPSMPTTNTWHRFEMTLQRSSAGGAADGYVKVAVDGATEYEKVNCITRDNSAYNWNLAEFFCGMTNWGGATETYIDDANLNDSWTRVELGNASTWSACTHKEIQPLTAWSDTSITLAANPGSFTGGTAYLYVVDATGAVNSNGYAIGVPEPATVTLLALGAIGMIRRRR